MKLYTEDRINAFVSKYLGLTSAQVSNLYEKILLEFIQEEHKAISINKNKELISKFEDIEHYLLTGIDLPIFVKQATSSNRKIMVIGSEPLRSWDYFRKYELNLYSQIAFNTPYSVHQFDAKNTVYFKIIEHLSFTHEIYLTDIRKLWFAGFERHKTFLESDLHNEFLIDEINSINPDHIVTFGQNAYDFILKIIKLNTIEINLHYLIHPSQRTQGNARRLFFEKNGIDVSQYQEIKESLDRTSKPFIEYLDKRIKL